MLQDQQKHKAKKKKKKKSCMSCISVLTYTFNKVKIYVFVTWRFVRQQVKVIQSNYRLLKEPTQVLFIFPTNIIFLPTVDGGKAHGLWMHTTDQTGRRRRKRKRKLLHGNKWRARAVVVFSLTGRLPIKADS